ncbi:MAG: DNA replication/repair protein RecF [Marinifilaceae bacterium]|jgi:DNA replication and repair protein RecF|nr:DNA replication/repair protein RecF [Marinifilaceae bacterium]
MLLDKLSLINYKNIKELELDFSPKINCIIGNNGVGKTNLLDSIYYLSFCKSYFSSTDTTNINHDEKFMVLEGIYKKNDKTELLNCGVKRGQKKVFKRNKKEYKKLIDHIGLFPLVMISPSDDRLITDGSEERRKYMDGVISQYDRMYLENLIKYNRVLQQRNKLLKNFAANGYFDADSLEVYDLQLMEYGNKIFDKRKEFLDKLIPVFQYYYTFISGDKELVSLEYKSQLFEFGFDSLLQNARMKDQFAQYTTVGIHKDDLLLKLGNYNIKKMGSQGQKKTFLIALKMAQFEFLKELSAIKPILLLDDIFDKLDASRVEAIVKLVSEERFGQIFISDTNRDHLDSILKNISMEYKLFYIDNNINALQLDK